MTWVDAWLIDHERMDAVCDDHWHKFLPHHKARALAMGWSVRDHAPVTLVQVNTDVATFRAYGQGWRLVRGSAYEEVGPVWRMHPDLAGWVNVETGELKSFGELRDVL